MLSIINGFFIFCSHADGHFSLWYQIHLSGVCVHISCCWWGIYFCSIKGQECIYGISSKKLFWINEVLTEFCNWFQTSSKTISKLAHPNAPLGYGLCFLNLAFDGFTNATQDSLTARYAYLKTDYKLWYNSNVFTFLGSMTKLNEFVSYSQLAVNCTFFVYHYYYWYFVRDEHTCTLFNLFMSHSSNPLRPPKHIEHIVYSTP